MSSGKLFDLSGRTAVVTGAASGLGRAIAVGLAEHGAKIVGADINKGDLTDTIQMVVKLGREAVAIETDVSRQEEVADLFREVARFGGGVDILVNNAGIPSHAEPEALDVEEWEKVQRVNVTGYFLCAQAAGRQMIAGGSGGSIINVSSIAGSTALGRGNLAFSVSKGAVNQLTRELAVEWAKHSIRVNAILPCQFRTPALQGLIDDPRYETDTLVTRFLQGIPMGRLGEPEDLVGPIVFLAAEASAMVTGTLLPVDGGNLALNAGGSHTW